MCVNYAPPRPKQLVEYFEAANAIEHDWPQEAWQDYQAPVLVAVAQQRQALVGNYGMIPKRRMPDGVRYSTMNARAETLGETRSFRQPWLRGQLCLVPMTGFFEPCYESGKAERWQIGMASGEPFAVAGLLRAWREPDEGVSYSFTQITINADEHPLMRRMHKPGDEKRSLVIVPERDYDAWLRCKDPELARSFLTLYPAEAMVAKPRPLPPKPRLQGEQHQGLF